MGVAQFLLYLLISKCTLLEQCNWYDCKYVWKFCFICIYVNFFLFCKTDCSLTIWDKKSCRTDFWGQTRLWNNESFVKTLFDRASEDIEEDDFEAVQRNTEILKSVSTQLLFVILRKSHCHYRLMRPHGSVRNFLFQFRRAPPPKNRSRARRSGRRARHRPVPNQVHDNNYSVFYQNTPSECILHFLKLQCLQNAIVTNMT